MELHLPVLGVLIIISLSSLCWSLCGLFASFSLPSVASFASTSNSGPEPALWVWVQQPWPQLQPLPTDQCSVSTGPALFFNWAQGGFGHHNAGEAKWPHFVLSAAATINPSVFSSHKVRSYLLLGNAEFRKCAHAH